MPLCEQCKGTGLHGDGLCASCAGSGGQPQPADRDPDPVLEKPARPSRGVTATGAV